jgi:hypothetical protein
MFASKTLEKLNEKLYQKRRVLITIDNDLEDVSYERDNALMLLARENDAYEAAVRAFEEAKVIMNTALERRQNAAKLTKQTANEYSSLVKNKAKVTDEIVDMHIKIHSIELEQNLAAVNQENQVTKILKKTFISDQLLKKIQKMPADIMLLIRDYLPYTVRISLINDSFNNVMAKCKGPEMPQLFESFLNYTATCPEFLPLIGRKEAKQQIPALIPRGLYWRTYTYCKCSKTNQPIAKLVKNKIRWAVELAKAGNPEFAYKVMKTVVIFGGNLMRNRPSASVSSKRYLTIQDLPSNYR